MNHKGGYRAARAAKKKGKEIHESSFANANLALREKGCGEKSSRASDLKRHLMIHTGKKANKCSQFDFASSWTSALRTHLKMHSGDRQPGFFRLHLD